MHVPGGIRGLAVHETARGSARPADQPAILFPPLTAIAAVIEAPAGDCRVSDSVAFAEVAATESAVLSDVPPLQPSRATSAQIPTVEIFACFTATLPVENCVTGR